MQLTNVFSSSDLLHSFFSPLVSHLSTTPRRLLELVPRIRDLIGLRRPSVPVHLGHLISDLDRHLAHSLVEVISAWISSISFIALNAFQGNPDIIVIVSLSLL